MATHEFVSFPKNATWGVLYGPLCSIVYQEDADRYLEALVQHSMSWGLSREESLETQKKNVGYWAGYFDRDTAERVWRLFRTKHPIFGLTWPTTQQAFDMGKTWANKHLTAKPEST